MSLSKKEQEYEEEAIRIMIASMSTVLANKIKVCFLWPRKNKDLASNEDVSNLILLLVEQSIPQWCLRHLHDLPRIDQMHSLVVLLALKTHRVFFTRVIHTLVD